jgi:hypothetical protein
MENTLTQPAVAPAAAAAPAHDAVCLNCGTALHGHFCAHCGQNAHTHRFTLRHLLLHDLPHSVWHVDKGLLYTLRHMIIRPGATIAEYLAGRRAAHFQPLTYLLLLAGLSALLLSAVHLNPYAATPDVPRLMVLTMERYMSSLFKYPSAVYVLLLPLNALLARWLLRPTRYNYAEMLISQAFISGTITALSLAVMFPLFLLLGHTPYFQGASMSTILISVIYPAWVYRQLLAPARMPVEDKWVRAISTAVLQLLGLFIILLIYIFSIMISLVRQDRALLTDFLAKTQAAKSQPAPRR